MLGHVQASSLNNNRVIIIVIDVDLFVVRIIRPGVSPMAVGVTKSPPVHKSGSVGSLGRDVIVISLASVLKPASMFRFVLDDKIRFLILLVKIKKAGQRNRT
jgi:hypothetical protein